MGRALDELSERPPEARECVLQLLDAMSALDDRALGTLCRSVMRHVDATYERLQHLRRQSLTSTIFLPSPRRRARTPA